MGSGSVEREKWVMAVIRVQIVAVLVVILLESKVSVWKV